MELKKQSFIIIYPNMQYFFSRGINYNNIVSNLLWIYKDPAHLVLVLNSGDHEEKYFTEKFGFSALPNVGAER